ncbi:MAG TPA: glycosyltransferase [Solirubrobacteraceae bacterium]|nr:glycosyltransferase [Solirubrobacteraceae bacterium]
MAGADQTTSVAALRERFPRVAVVHEWLTIPGGSEKVLEEILRLVPHAELFTSVYDPAPWSSMITDRPVHPSFLNRVPGARDHYTRLLPFMDLAFRSFDLTRFDLVISSNHACAKNVRTPAGVPHVCYCHTPMRYAWDPSMLEGEAIGPLARRLAPLATAWLRRVDRRRAYAPDVFVANSNYVAARIVNAYGRSSQVIHPPVRIDSMLSIERDERDAYLVFGRVVPYKRVGVAVEACERLGQRLLVAGTGRDLERVRQLAGRHTEFLGHVPDVDVPRLFAQARALLFPGPEDFGMVAVEAQAAGLPVVAYEAGGVTDSVLDGETGVLYEPGTVDGLIGGIRRFESLSFDHQRIRENALRFAPDRFAAAFADLLMTTPRPGARR